MRRRSSSCSTNFVVHANDKHTVDVDLVGNSIGPAHASLIVQSNAPTVQRHAGQARGGDAAGSWTALAQARNALQRHTAGPERYRLGSPVGCLFRAGTQVLMADGTRGASRTSRSVTRSWRSRSATTSSTVRRAASRADRARVAPRRRPCAARRRRNPCDRGASLGVREGWRHRRLPAHRRVRPGRPRFASTSAVPRGGWAGERSVGLGGDGLHFNPTGARISSASGGRRGTSFTTTSR